MLALEQQQEEQLLLDLVYVTSILFYFHILFLFLSRFIIIIFWSIRAFRRDIYIWFNFYNLRSKQVLFLTFFFSLQEAFFLCVWKRTEYWYSGDLSFLKNWKVPTSSDSPILEFPWKQSEPGVLDLFSQPDFFFLPTCLSSPLPFRMFPAFSTMPVPWQLMVGRSTSQWSDAKSCLILCPSLPKVEWNSGAEKQSHSERMGNYLLREFR